MFQYQIKFQAVICFRVMTSSIFFFKWKPPIFFLDSDSPLNFVVLHKEIFEKKKIHLEKTNFITNKNKSKTALLST
jgi:hypothetical protein